MVHTLLMHTHKTNRPCNGIDFYREHVTLAKFQLTLLAQKKNELQHFTNSVEELFLFLLQGDRE